MAPQKMAEREQTKQQPLAVFIFGRPGSGKGTQSRALSDHFGFVRYTTSDLIRAAFERGEKPEYKKMYDDGLLLPEDWIIELVTTAIRETGKHNQGIILDGAARKLDEAEAEVIAARAVYGADNVVGLFLDVSEAEVRQRLSKRLICSTCGRSLMPGRVKEGDRCPDPDCGGIVTKREMDDSSIVDVRMEEFQKHTAPVIDYFRKEGLLVSISAQAQPEEVTQETITALEALRQRQ